MQKRFFSLRRQREKKHELVQNYQDIQADFKLSIESPNNPGPKILRYALKEMDENSFEDFQMTS